VRDPQFRGVDGASELVEQAFAPAGEARVATAARARQIDAFVAADAAGAAEQHDKIPPQRCWGGS